MIPPLVTIWDGEKFEPLKRFTAVCNRECVVGQAYRMVVEEERSKASHAHFFATVHELWLNLPEDLAEEYFDEDKLRKTALIRCGYRNERDIVLPSHDDALRVAAFIEPMDRYAIVTVRGCVVRVYSARSQSLKAMGKAEFQESKDKTLAWISELIGVREVPSSHAA